MPPENNPLVDYRLDMIEKAITKVTENLSKLTTLEQRQQENRETTARIFLAIEKMEERQVAYEREMDSRVAAVEKELPTLTMVRGWVITAATGAIGCFALYLFNTITK